MRFCQLRSVLVAIIVTPLSAGAASFTPIEHSVFSSYATAVSDDGSTVVGYVHSGSGYPTGAFVWQATTGLRLLDAPSGGGVSFAASGVSGDGTVVVGSVTSSSGFRATAWDATGAARLLALPDDATESGASAVSADGSVIVGSAGTGSYGYGNAVVWGATGSPRVLRDESGAIRDSTAYDVSADGSVVVGLAAGSGANGQVVTQGFAWDETSGLRGLGGLPGEPIGGWANAVTPDGSTVVGRAPFAGGVGFGRDVPVIWDGVSGMRSIGSGGAISEARDVSADRNVIVGTGWVGTSSGAFIWDPVAGIRSLSFYLRSLGIDLQGWSLEEANSISADGTVIVGAGRNPSGKKVAWIAVIPEPGSTVLLGFGLAFLSHRSRRRG